MRAGRGWVVLLLATVGAAACGDGGPADKADEKPATTVAAEPLITVPTTHEPLVGSTVPATQPAAPTTTVLYGSLPHDLGIPGADQLVLGSSSSLTNSMTVRGRAIDDVVDFVRTELNGLGYAVNADLSFAGPGSVGQVTVAQIGDEDVQIVVVLTGRPQ